MGSNPILNKKFKIFMNRYLNKPFSPHLTIYKVQNSSLFSILHRFSVSFFLILFFLFNLLLSFLVNLNYYFYLVINYYFYFTFIFFYKVIFLFFLFHILNGFKIVLTIFNIISNNKSEFYWKIIIIIFFMLYLIFIF